MATGSVLPCVVDPAPTAGETSRLERETLMLRQQRGYWKSQHSHSRRREGRLQQEVRQLRAQLKDGLMDKGCVPWLYPFAGKARQADEPSGAVRPSNPPELVEARQQAGYWKQRFEQVREREERLKQEVERLQAEVKKYERQLFERKSEKRSSSGSAGSKPSPRKRGQQPGKPGPKRRDTSQLPVREETHDLPESERHCPKCARPLAEFPGTEDSEQIEIEVRAHKRKIRRKRYKPTCDCGEVAGIVTAPGPPKLIPKGLYGTSVWVTVLLDKYAFLRPTHRLLADLKTYGVDLSLGTLTGGLKCLAALFEPIQAEIIRKNLAENRWHADETTWKVFGESEIKPDPRWKFWVFQSPSAVVVLLDPTRSARVPQDHFEGVEDGILIVDRFSSYKAIVQVKQGKILLAFCWVHVRRDFLNLAKNWPGQEPWGLSWVEAIGELFHLNRLRVEAPAEEFAARDEELRGAVQRMQSLCEEQLSEPDLHPARRKVLKSLGNHWSGLTLFLDHPEVPMDNSQAERTLRGPVLARNQFYGSFALWSGQLAARMFSLFATLKLWKINPRTWMHKYLQACALNGGKPPPEAQRFLPWNLCEDERRALGRPALGEPFA